MVGDAGIGTIGSDADGALQVGPPQGGTLLTIAVHNIGMRMMKYIEPSAGDDDVPGPDRPDEIRMTRRAAAMVRGLQDFRFQSVEWRISEWGKLSQSVTQFGP